MLDIEEDLGGFEVCKPLSTGASIERAVVCVGSGERLKVLHVPDLLQPKFPTHGFICWYCWKQRQTLFSWASKSLQRVTAAMK